MCDVVYAMAESSVPPYNSIRSTDIDIQIHTEINNLTYTELKTINNTVTVPISPVRSYVEEAARYDVDVYIMNNTALGDVVTAKNGTWLHVDATPTPTCSGTVKEEVFRNSLFIGVVCFVVYTAAGFLVDCIHRKQLMSKL